MSRSGPVALLWLAAGDEPVRPQEEPVELGEDLDLLPDVVAQGAWDTPRGIVLALNDQ